MAAQHYREAGEIDTLYYSTDEGESWHTYQFSDEVSISVLFHKIQCGLVETKHTSTNSISL